MASKKKQEALAVAAPANTGIMKWDDELAKYAEAASAKEQIIAGQFLSVKSGQMSLGGNPIKGNTVNVVVLKDIYENTYYASEYDADNKVPPDCYAFGDDEKTMAPHPQASDPQADKCANCKMNEWGSSTKGKRTGKACQNRRRLALIPAGDLSPEAVAKAEVVYFKVPVTSGKFWGAYVKSVASIHKVPPFAVVTNITCEPDPKTQVRVGFELVERAPQESLGALLARMQEQQDAIRFPYPEAKDEPAKPAPKAKSKSKF
jgi:hypothetical protein